jgi:Tol biopolymer transport system component
MPAFSAQHRFVFSRPCLVAGLVLCARLAIGASSPASASLPGKAAALQVRKVELLSGDRAGFMRPVWSPDGQWLGLGRGGMAGIELLRRDGKEWKTLPADPGSGYKFAWSPDGGHIAYRAMRSESNATTYVIKSVELATGKAVELCKPAAEISPPVWMGSNGHQRVSFMVGTNLVSTPWKPSKATAAPAPALKPVPLLYTDRGQIWRAGPDGAPTKPITKDGGMDAVWSPDRSKVVYSQMGTLIIMEPDGSKKRELARGHHPSWSPDGKMLVYAVSHDDGHQVLASDLYVINADGTEPTRLTNTPEMLECEPAWSPDGKCIACRTEDAGRVLLLWLQ